MYIYVCVCMQESIYGCTYMCKYGCVCFYSHEEAQILATSGECYVYTTSRAENTSKEDSPPTSCITAETGRKRRKRVKRKRLNRGAARLQR